MEGQALSPPSSNRYFVFYMIAKGILQNLKLIKQPSWSWVFPMQSRFGNREHFRSRKMNPDKIDWEAKQGSDGLR